MTETFLGIISLLGVVYCIFTKQVVKALGFIVFAGTFFLLIPNISDGVKTNFYQAGAMVLFVAGTIIVVYKKKNKNKENVEEKVEEKTENE